ncbi:helix-turn-helix domain-containing protein [uncultured Nonlabens sp.]|jgi:excisionase family DNA binding protein|uniref:helix-turn-helix domain-containing protein n=1 Tax=uncultured Nonlabens sp. TaxID=859306 RepID=UPI0030D7E017|tara:strand:+ start:243 stop:524 length:282 start_codon:yes stop_codon:yes gene_type:complete
METKLIQVRDVTLEELAEAVSEKLMTKIRLYMNQADESKDHDTYLTREEAAQYLSISLGTLWSWTKKGLFKSRRLGNKIYYLKADLKNAIQTI